jgi:molybdopterin/thiamine biosynthesis adenylyltransferase
MDNRLARQSFLGTDSHIVLAATRVGLVGLGGGGSHLVQQLAHLGVGRFVVIDPDHVEDTNLNRLVGATARDVLNRTPKVDIAERVILGVTPKADVVKVCKKWQTGAELLRDCTVIFGCVDSFTERAQLEVAARRYLIPYLDVGMDVHKVGDAYCIAGQVILSCPGELCLRCLGVITEDRLKREAEHYGAAGGRPQVVWPNGILASAAVGLFVQLVTPWHQKPIATAYLEYDGNAHTMVQSPRLTFMSGRVCAHFTELDNLGDPFWRPSSEETPPAPPPSRLRRILKRIHLPGLH